MKREHGRGRVEKDPCSQVPVYRVPQRRWLLQILVQPWHLTRARVHSTVSLRSAEGCYIPAGKGLQGIDGIHFQEFSFVMLAPWGSSTIVKPCSQPSHASLFIFPVSGRCPKHSDGCTRIHHQTLVVYREGKRL